MIDIVVDDSREDELGSLSCVSSDFVDIEGLTDSSDEAESDDMPEIPMEFNETAVETMEDLVEEAPFTRTGWESSSFEEYSDFPSGWSDTESSDSAGSQTDMTRLLMANAYSLTLLSDYDSASHAVVPKLETPPKALIGLASTSSSLSDFTTANANHSALTSPADPLLMTSHQLGAINTVPLNPPPPSLLSTSLSNQQLYSRPNGTNEDPSPLPTPAQSRHQTSNISSLTSNSISSAGKRRRNSSVGAGSDKVSETDPPTIIPIDEVVDTEKLYSSSSSRSPSPEPSSKQYQEYLQALSRWDRIPIGTFRRSRRRTSAPKLSVSSAMKTPNTTLLSDHTLNVAKRNTTGKIVINHGCSPLLYPVLDSHVHNYATSHNLNEYEEGREVGQDTDPLLALFCVPANDDMLEDPPNTLERVKNRKRKRSRRRR
ncbi:hypothetical protein K493DRAFT_60228 [Basidiobolus meristosporus CBS 931.73]|uniref:Uncharacterized protein n=1 Tax=Basidiobolus meristosporus CBS 931.73 TaxID=1314790 RepID=A0A1Y1XX00_9FUNG|nr:hypothetical protein K493DRAFT_60228 [Basidiobolus meristosporus CBS 931.73]|eukprot:ORX90279.1 hypothetical protein K493DRAFT_60228 [Basidiobolus meristosporus CBS 931.73]